jgi:hypothetical protein
MSASPKSRVEVAGNLAAIARTRKIEPVAPDDPAMAFMPPLASLEELSSSGEAPTPETAASSKGDTSPATKDASPTETPPSEPHSKRGEQPRQRDRAHSLTRSQDTTSQPARVNKAASTDYTRVTLRLRNDVVTRLVAYGLPRNKRYTTVIEDFILTGLERQKD